MVSTEFLNRALLALEDFLVIKRKIPILIVFSANFKV